MSQYNIPKGLPADLDAILKRSSKLSSIRDYELHNVKLAIDNNSVCAEQFKLDESSNISEEKRRAINKLVVYSNTTRIASRCLSSGVYGGIQSRRVSGGRHAEQVNEYVNSLDYKSASTSNFVNAIAYGTSTMSPVINDSGELETYLFDSVGSYIFTSPTNVKKTVAVVEVDKAGYIRFISTGGSGIIGGKDFTPEIVLYNEPLPYLFATISRGECQLANKCAYGTSILKPTLEYNNIISMAYFNLNLLIRATNTSLLVINAAKEEPEYFKVGVNDAMKLEAGDSASYLKPEADLDQIINTIDSQFNFLSSILGMPTSIFKPSDGQSAESAFLAGSALASQVKQFATRFAELETDYVYKTLAFLHYNDGEAYTIRQLKAMYDVSIKIDPYFETESLASKADSYSKLVDANLIKFDDAVKKINPEYTDADVAELLAEKMKPIQGMPYNSLNP